MIGVPRNGTMESFWAMLVVPEWVKLLTAWNSTCIRSSFHRITARPDASLVTDELELVLPHTILQIIKKYLILLG